MDSCICFIMNFDFDMAMGRCYGKNIENSTQIMNQQTQNLTILKDIKKPTNQQLSQEDSS